jgi:cell division protein FtsZ
MPVKKRIRRQDLTGDNINLSQKSVQPKQGNTFWRQIADTKSFHTPVTDESGDVPVMQNFIKHALELSKEDTDALLHSGPFRHRPAVIGCSDMGCQIASQIAEAGDTDVLTLFVNLTAPWKESLHDTVNDELLFFDIPLQKCLKSYEPSHLDEHAAEHACDRLKQALDAHSTGLCIIIAHMGEESGTGAAPLIARMAREMGIVVLGIALCPPIDRKSAQPFEGEALSDLRAAADSVLVMKMEVPILEPQGQNSWQFDPETEKTIVDTVMRVCDLVNGKSLMGVDPLDVFSILGQPGDAVLWHGIGQGEDRAVDAIEKGRFYTRSKSGVAGARGCLISVHGGADLTLNDAEEATRCLGTMCDPDALVIWGARAFNRLEGRLDVMALFTGIKIEHAPGCGVSCIFIQSDSSKP